MPKNYAYRYDLSPMESNFPARITLFDKPGKECYVDKHWHKTIEINYVLKGDLAIQINDEKFIISDNEYEIINADDVHKTSGRYDDSYIKYIVIKYSCSFTKNYFSDIDKYRFEIKDGEYKELIREHLAKIANYIDTEDEFAEMHILSALINILDIMFTNCRVLCSESKNIRSNINCDYTKIAIEYIKEHYAEAITLETVASVVGLSPTYFSKLFKIKSNKTFLVYLNDIRMINTLSDIENYGITETEAALNNGFANVKSFIRTFKRNYNCTLSQYMSEHNSLPVINGYNRIFRENIYKYK